MTKSSKEIIEEGGPAFPNKSDIVSTRPEGMTLRDWFAGQALAGIAASYTLKEAASYAYALADKMLMEREK